MTLEQIKDQLETIYRLRYDEDTVGDIANKLISEVDERIRQEKALAYENKVNDLLTKVLFKDKYGDL